MSGRSAKGTKRYGGSGSHSSLSGKMARDRVAVPNYPWEGVFESAEQIEMYLSGKSITCLICGGEYAALGKHLSSHAISAKEYKVKFNIPFRYGLQIQRLSEIKSLIMTAYNKEELPEEREARIKKAHAAAVASNTGKKRNDIPAMSKEATYKGCSKKTGRQVNREHLKKVEVPCSECGVLCEKSLLVVKRGKKVLCAECKHESEKASYKKYGEKNKEKRRDYSKEYYEKNKEKALERSKANYEKNKEHIAKKSKERYERTKKNLTTKENNK